MFKFLTYATPILVKGLGSTPIGWAAATFGSSAAEDRAGLVAVARVGAEPVAVVDNSATAEKVEFVAAGRAELAVDKVDKSGLVEFCEIAESAAD